MKKSTIIQNTLISIFLICMVVLALVFLPEFGEESDNLKQVKSMECPLLKEKIYNKDFEHWYRISDDAIFEYEWRCEK